jgi:magnesium transporter
LSDVSTLEELGQRYGIAPLLLEDMLNTDQRPKIEEHDECLYAIVKMWDVAADTGEVTSEQVSFVLTGDTLISLQERPGDVFGQIRERIRRGKGRVRSMGADYLLYCLLDAVVDRYLVVLEAIGERIEELEVLIESDGGRNAAARIHSLTRTILFLRRSIWPLRNALSRLMRETPRMVSGELDVFLRDLHDHTVAAADGLETFRDMLRSLRDSNATNISNRMNEVMKVLTMISTVFIPLSFIVGFYGMNFAYMPELQWRYGYFAVIAALVAVSLGMVAFFKRKRWI